MSPLRLCLLWLVLLAAFSASMARAEAPETPETAQAWFQRGVSLSRAAQWSDARAAYLQSLQLEPRVSTYFNLATASLKLQLGRATLLALDDFAGLADPRMHAEFLAEAARMRAEAFALTGTVVLTGLVADATVEVDSETRSSPVGPEHQISLDPGHHVLLLRAPSYVTSALEVDVARGVTTHLSPTLSKLPVHVPATSPVTSAPLAPSAPSAPSEGHATHRLWLWGGIAAVGLGALATVLVLTLRSDPEGAPRGAGGSLNMVFN